MAPSGSGDPEGSDPDAMLTETTQIADMNGEAAEHAGNCSASSSPNESSRTDRPTNNKRKFYDSAYPKESIHSKRVRIDEDQLKDSRVATTFTVDRTKQLPAEIWQHIFTYVPPRALGRLLLANKLFYMFLHPSPTVSVSSHCSTMYSALKSLKPNVIWQASRRLFWPRMPTPLKGKSELDMWRLVCSLSCQFCSSKSIVRSLDTNDVWHRGPGAKGVSPVFLFSVFACGSCLSSKSVKEIDILLSPAIPSLLLPALAMVFVTDEQHIIPPRVMQSETLSSKPQVHKVYWSDHLDQIRAEFETVKLLGSAAAEEWVKGLENRGKAALADASRWEKWDSIGGVHQMRVNLSSLSLIPETTKIVKSHSSSQSQGHMPGNSPQNPSYIECPRQESDQSNTLSTTAKVDTNGSLARPLVQQKRTKEEVAELKAKRRAEIERRALLLDPPLVSSVLAHIPSFQAALQIITPLDDNAWDLLKPRLLAQKEEAESREKERNANACALREKLGFKKEPIVSKDPRAITDKDWDEIQGPLRGRISNFADEIIQNGWNNGEKVRKKSSPQFAAEVLLYVHKRFYAEVAKDAAVAVTAGLEPTIDPPKGPWTQKLTLENMKWIFDLKVKPHTEPYRKELFLCNGCSGNNKYYGFEGVIQHYAAKHTGALSVGNVVVHWRAEWPEVPPFNPDPRHPDAHQPNPDSVASHSSQGTNPNSGYHAYSHGPPIAGYPAHGYAAPVPPHRFDPEQHAPFPVARQEPNAPIYGAPHPPPYYAQYAHDGGYPPYPSRPPYGASFFSHGLPSSYGGPPNPMPHGYHYTSYPDPRGPYGSHVSGASYKTRLSIMIRVAKEAWNKVSGVKDLHSAVKICVVIHRIAKTFQDDFAEPAQLAMFIDALSNSKEIRCIRNTNGLACKTCMVTNRTPEKATFSLPQLTNHFSKHHSKGLRTQGAQPLDWRIDMILLPDMSVLQKLRQILENHRPAHDLVADTLPWAFEEQTNDVPKAQEWPKATDSALGGTRSGLDHTSGQPSGNGALKSRPDISRANKQGQLVENSHLDMSKRDVGKRKHDGHEPPRSPSYNPAPPNTIPNLRPASEVYATAKRKRGAGQTPRRLALDSTSQRPHSPRHHPGSDTTSPCLLSRQQQDLASGYRLESHEYLKSAQDQNAHIQTGPGIGYRDPEPRRHMATDSSQTYKANMSRGGGLERGTGELQRPSVPPPTNVATSQPTEDSFTLLDALESHGRGHEEIIYVDTSGREIGRATRPVEMRARSHRLAYHGNPSPGLQRRPPSPGYDVHQPEIYHIRGSGPRYTPHGHRRESDQVAHTVYYDNSRPPPGPSVDAYELVKVRDPEGDYFIRRPVRRQEDEHYIYERRPVRRNSGSYVFYGTIDDRPAARPAAYVADGRTVSSAPTRHAASVEYNEDYDAWHPVPGPREPPVH